MLVLFCARYAIEKAGIWRQLNTSPSPQTQSMICLHILKVKSK